MSSVKPMQQSIFNLISIIFYRETGQDDQKNSRKHQVPSAEIHTVSNEYGKGERFENTCMRRGTERPPSGA